MKIYSDAAVTIADIETINAKQNRQIRQMRVWLGVSFLANLAVTLILFVTK